MGSGCLPPLPPLDMGPEYLTPFPATGIWWSSNSVPVLTPSDGHQNKYGCQAGGMHPIGMLSYRCSGGSRIFHKESAASKEERAPTYYSANFFRKLHEKEIFWEWSGGYAPPPKCNVHRTMGKNAVLPVDLLVTWTFPVFFGQDLAQPAVRQNIMRLYLHLWLVMTFEESVPGA